MVVKIWAFTKYTSAGASSRYRTFQYLEAWRAEGWTVHIQSLFSDAYLARKYASGRAPVGLVLRALMLRVWAVICVPPRSVVWVEYELVPYFPALFERWLVWRGCRLVTDYDDALFHQYGEHESKWVRRFLGGKIPAVMRLSHAVIAGNAYLADFASRSGAANVRIIPTVIDLERYAKCASLPASDDFVIGWIGSPSTTRYVADISSALARFCAEVPAAKVRLVGASRIDLHGAPLELFAWNEDTEVADICSFDVGIMPLPDEPWARGKCGFKLIQYMACGVPVVASPVGVNVAIVQEGGGGFLARTSDEWVDAFRRMHADAALRKRLGASGRACAEAKYSLVVTAPQLVDVLAAAQKSG